MPSQYRLLGFDADDTLWHNEDLYANTQQQFTALLSGYRSEKEILDGLYQTEMRNLALFGYGIKGFTLSMIETAIELTGGAVQGSEIQKILNFSREMLGAEIRLLANVTETISLLAKKYPLVIITKGDLFDQETKLARSGLGEYFQHFEILSDKTADRYASFLARMEVRPDEFLMVGNSLRSDILPVIELGGMAVYIPYHLTWAHESAETIGQRFYELEHMGQLPDLLRRLENGEK